MEQQEPRKEYVNNLNSFLKNFVEINDTFMTELEKHSGREYIKEVKKFDTDMEKKIFIFLEFTRERSTCNEMITILENSGQERAATKLKGYNVSPEFMKYTYDTHLTVTKTITPKTGGSKYFEMDGSPKGVCFIINNMKDVLGKESLRFRLVFEQLGFDVTEAFDLTAQELVEGLNILANHERLSNDNALVIMVISHGRDEKILFKDGSEIGIADVVEFFSDTNCPNLSTKPKLFFFNCCRSSTNGGEFMQNITRDAKWKNNNKYTMICYACSQGDHSWYIPGQYTHFGQALSHCIAQYSCDKSVQYILNATAERMKPYGEVDIRNYATKRELFFNPGVAKLAFN